jgi:pyruvate dehydrogenase E2 component (dihydrolipoamide acetyltransferase)
MPDVTAGSDDGVLARWLVEESARFDAAQTIAYVETDDELFSVEAGRPGLLLKTLVEPGTRVAPGTPIGILSEPWEQVAELDAVLLELGLPELGLAEPGMAEPTTAEPTVAEPTVAEPEGASASSWFEAAVAGHRAEADAEPAPAVAPQPLTIVAELDPLEPEPPGGREGPEAGRHSAVTGLVVPDDLQALARDPLVSTGSTGSTGSSDEGGASLHHHYLRARVRADRLIALSAELERDHPRSGVSDLITRAVLAAHRQVPQLAVAHLDDGHRAALGIPVSHPGRFGVEEAVVVVPTGQTAALAVGAVRDEPVIDGGAVVPGKLITLTLSVRPGRVDDVQASRWLAVLVALLERPEWLRD